MVHVLFLKDRLLGLLLSIIITILFYPVLGYSAVLNVTNEDELREALNTAESNGEDDFVNIASGTYNTNGETFIFESDEDFSLTIVGKGAGMTILDGGDIDRVFEINSVSDSDVLISISGLTIQNGFHISTPDEMSISDGAGIYITSQNISIMDCHFINNNVSRAGSGGGMYASAQSELILSGDLFSQNSAAFSGGGAYLSATELILSGNEFIGNSAELGDGGGAYAVSGEFNFSKIQESVVTNNIFTQNSCGSRWGGGALFSSFDRLTLTNNTFTLNSSDSSGSTLVIDNIPYSLTESIVTNIFNNIVIANSNIEGNDLLVRTFRLPIPTPPPPGVPITPDIINYGTVNIFNNDIGVFDVEISLECNFPEYTCLLEVNEENNIDEEPLFVDAESGDVGLLSNSPCIDAGDPNAPDLPAVDIYGNPRGPIPDMGAVEYIAGAANNGGCSLANSPDTSSLAVFLALPVLIFIRRIIKINRSN